MSEPHSSNSSDSSNEESEEQECQKPPKRFRSNSWEGSSSMNVVPEEETARPGTSAEPVENETESDSEVQIEMNVLSTPPNESEYQICSHIPFLDVSLYVKAGDYLEVGLSKVYGPDHFYFHLGEFHILFRNLLKRMMTFYSINPELPILPEEDINAGQICAVNYTKLEGERMLWLRGEIKEKRWGPKVLINLVDYEKTVEVYKKSLKYLYEDFGELPRQACSGGLANVRPTNGQVFYTEEATERFMNLTFERELLARVVSINEEDSFLHLVLTSTTEEEFNINDVLVEEGHADLDY